jgi:hypothetical protein
MNIFSLIYIFKIIIIFYIIIKNDNDKMLKLLGKEIIAKALHLKRIFKLIAQYEEDEIYNNLFE